MFHRFLRAVAKWHLPLQVVIMIAAAFQYVLSAPRQILWFTLLLSSLFAVLTLLAVWHREHWYDRSFTAACLAALIYALIHWSPFFD